MGLLSNLTRQAPLVAYWHENVTIAVINDAKAMIPKASMKPPILQRKSPPTTAHWPLTPLPVDIPFDGDLIRDASGKIGFYKPIVFPNDFWLLRQNAYPINETVR